MTILVGTDIVSVGRIRTLTNDPGEAFLTRTFTQVELAICAGDARRLAGRWAAKESVLKALSIGIDRVALTAIEIDRAPNGAPLLRLLGNAAADLPAEGDYAWSLSISHEKAYATAVALAVVTPQQPAPENTSR